MNTFQFIDNLGFVQDVTFCLDLTEAIDFANKNDLTLCAIKDLGPVSDRVWAEVLL